MKKLQFYFVLPSAFTNFVIMKKQSDRTASFRMPAEWEHQRAVMLTWPHEGTDWRPYLDDIQSTCVKMVEAIARFEDVIIAAEHPDEVRALLSHIDEGKVNIYLVTNDDTWARDHGPITLIDSESSERLLLDFRFNGWGNKFSADNDNLLTRRLFNEGAFEGEIIDNNDFVLEGGSIETDGQGTLFTTAQCLLAPNRNQPLSQMEIEGELKRRLNMERIVWLHHGNPIGDDTDGHIDTTVRLAPNDTLLYVSCTPDDEQYDDFRLLEDELKTLHTADRRRYRLLSLPSPKPIYFDGERLPATYANFLVVNGAVIVPIYNQPDSDSEAMRVIGEAFPDREIVGIDATVIIRQHGSIHCMTMQIY